MTSTVPQYQNFIPFDRFVVDWVLFSTIIELTQDAKFCTANLEPKILNLKNAVHASSPSHVFTDLNRNTSDLSQALNANFDNEFEIYKINRFIRPKIRVLKELELKGNFRFNPRVLNLLAGTRKDLEEIGDVLGKKRTFRMVKPAN